MLTYGDGVSDVNLKKLLNYHKKNKRIATLTTVRPPARFGAIKLAEIQLSTLKRSPDWMKAG